jgi:uncharacterized protein YjbI with pentapeptide repeats
MEFLVNPMSISLRTLTSFWLLVLLAAPAIAENVNQLAQLLSTKKCPMCDLSGSGLVFADLTGANLAGANLAGANLSQANLSGANLTGANLSGTSFNSANLTGADLRGAIMNGTDLRGAYLTNANFTATNLDSAFVQGVVGMPTNAGTPELFFGWGLLESRKGNFKAALSNYNKALNLDPHFAPGYLGRGLALLKMGDETAAKQNVEYASKLFEEEKNTDGYDTAQNFLKNLQAMQDARANGAGTPQLDAIVRGVASLALQFLLR